MPRSFCGLGVTGAVIGGVRAGCAHVGADDRINEMTTKATIRMLGEIAAGVPGASALPAFAIDDEPRSGARKTDARRGVELSPRRNVEAFDSASPRKTSAAR